VENLQARLLALKKDQAHRTVHSGREGRGSA
jgi:hypothetical protein